MSRGPGVIQRRILDATLDGPVCAEKLRWDIATAAGAVEDDGARPFPGGGITKAFDQSFSRAVRGLVGGRRLVRSARRLETLDELVQLYPYKSRSLRKRRLREGLLPCVARRLADGHKSRFSVMEIERALATTREAAEWEPWDRELRSHESNAPDPLREAVFDIRVKMRELFTARRVQLRVSLLELLQRTTKAAESDLLTTLERLQAAYWQWYPRGSIKHVRLKGLVHHAADLSERQRVRLHDEAKRWLLEEHQELLESMPSHKPAPPRDERSDGWDLRYFLNLTPESQVQFDPLLEQLIDRDVYRRFQFLRRPAS